jgi:heptosyltransferase-2
MQKMLVIQTAFIGDVVLATALLEKLHQYYPGASIDFLVRKGNESLLHQHPFLNEILVWDKKKSKYLHWLQLLRRIRNKRYDLVVNAQRFAATGLLTGLSGACRKTGFDKNPFSFLFTDVIQHAWNDPAHPLHEIERNQQLIAAITDHQAAKPKLYPSAADYGHIQYLQSSPYICIAPASVWFTKQYPPLQWILFCKQVPANYKIYLLGAPGDRALCAQIQSGAGQDNISILAGELSFLQSAALQQGAVMNYVNDSAPLHFASAVNAPTAAVFCSTLPSFGFGPLADNRHVIEVQTALSCRPCGMHGKKNCPEKHFNCAMQIAAGQLMAALPQQP